MDAGSASIVNDLRPMLIMYEGGRVERFLGVQRVPADPTDDVVPSKDIQISEDVSARLYLPKSVQDGGEGGSEQNKKKKVPLLIYFHGGGFAIESASSPTYHHYLRDVAARIPAVVVSVDYRLAPEHPLPAAYDDSWSAVEWALSPGADPWVTEHADLSRVFLAGDSAGGNIVHHMGLRFGKEREAKVAGLVLIHPFFSWDHKGYGETAKSNEAGREFVKRLWELVCGGDPSKGRLDHPWIDPKSDPEVGKIGCDRILVFVAENDGLRFCGEYYSEEVLKKADGWSGKVEVVEHPGEGHVFHLLNRSGDSAAKLMDKFVDFLKTT